MRQHSCLRMFEFVIERLLGLPIGGLRVWCSSMTGRVQLPRLQVSRLLQDSLQMRLR